MEIKMTSHVVSRLRASCLGAAACGTLLMLSGTVQATDHISFNMIRSKGLPSGCATHAAASVTVRSLGFAEKMTFTVSGLPAGTALDLFVIQVPNAPFGVSWYVGDLQVGGNGTVTKSFISRFNDE